MNLHHRDDDAPPSTKHIELAAAVADAYGRPRSGRADEYHRLRAAGAENLAWGRLYEGHVNALQLIARLGTPPQRIRADGDATSGKLFGVWNTQAADGVTISAFDTAGFTLTGRKTFASGAGSVARGLITAAWPDGSPQLVLVPMDRAAVVIDQSFWKPYGMEDSDSFAVDFSGVRLDHSALIGQASDYERSPWFTAGASRFVAVQTGGVEQLVTDFGAFIRRREYHDDPIQLSRFGECIIAARTARLWTEACVDAWNAFDATSDSGTIAALLTTVDAARSAVERAALDVAERVERGVGARGLLDGEPFARRLRDLRMYLRQPAIDATLVRVAQASLTPRAIA